MSENPYRAPDADLRVEGVLSGRVEDLRKVATAQRGMILAIGIYLVAAMARFALPPQLALIPGLAALLAATLGLVFTVMLAVRVYNPVVGGILGILCFVPLLGFLILVGLSQRATRILQQNGIQVGFGGARMSDFDALETDDA